MQEKRARYGGPSLEAPFAAAQGKQDKRKVRPAKAGPSFRYAHPGLKSGAATFNFRGFHFTFRGRERVRDDNAGRRKKWGRELSSGAKAQRADVRYVGALRGGNPSSPRRSPTESGQAAAAT